MREAPSKVVLPRHLLLSSLCFLHGTMRASEGMLKAAIGACEPGELRSYFKRHLAEETGHVQLLEADLDRLGVTTILEFPEAAQLAGAQYYYIEHEHPALLLGYMAALESNALNVEQVDALEALHGPLTCSRHHALHDGGHTAELREQIEKLPPALKERAIQNEQWTQQDYRTRVAPKIVAASTYFLTRH